MQERQRKGPFFSCRNANAKDLDPPHPSQTSSFSPAYARFFTYLSVGVSARCTGMSANLSNQ
eukprot:72040-Chlamydomonas_euryale.AAC.1